MVSREKLGDVERLAIWDHKQHHGNLAWYSLKMGYTYYGVEPTVQVRMDFVNNLTEKIQGKFVTIYMFKIFYRGP